MPELTVSRLPFLAPMRPYVSFAMTDLRYYQRLRKALRPLEATGLLRSAESRLSIMAGKDRSREARRLIAEAHLLLLLLSISFFACQHCIDHELTSAQQRAVQSQLAHLLPIHLLPVSENVLALYGISPETLLPGDGTPVVTRNKQQDRAWTEIVERLFRLIYAPERDFNAQLRESVYQIVIAAKRDTTTLDGAEIARLQSLEQEAWAIFMEVFLPIIRQAWIDVKKTPAGNLSEEQISDAESDFYCSVYHHLFLSEERLIHQYSPEQFPSLKHFVYHISVKLLTQ